MSMGGELVGEIGLPIIASGVATSVWAYWFEPQQLTTPLMSAAHEWRAPEAISVGASTVFGAKDWPNSCQPQHATFLVNCRSDPTMSVPLAAQV
eukprot:CAMPEP_0180262616 /NCGR_PEP_ID=MMETSP0987-20121128/44822_1 /TAXON_ID=697907 /ORGANISM="non described non described, Strain CCMP2293" /LENGTH=93 /DNA_ID=CAMNT_0022232749 /DNA_START=630 /DNA_END=907 /DNA_ORIENTATION=+